MVKATIEYADGTKETVKKKSYIEMAEYYEKARERGAVGFLAQGNKGSVETVPVDGKTILAEVKEAEG